MTSTNSAKIIDGKLVSAETRKKIAEECGEFKEKTGIIPGLAVVLVGDDAASQIYVRNKRRACEEVGFASKSFELPSDTDEQTLLNLIESLNNDSEIHGILLQLPLPRHLDENKILLSISPEKDVDAFHPVNVGKIMIGNYTFAPCTPWGIMTLLKYYNIDISGKECVVVGRSNIVGKPQALLLLAQNGTVTVAHSKTKNLKEVCRRADILVVAIGKAKFITSDMIKPEAVVIDVGMNHDCNGKLCGDVDFDNAIRVASYITPVPGGVGPMTITTLMGNTLKAAKTYGVK
jgi:methylenetetrahydrofolate dehydrogenase (NADP+)/methenyltetrahydrofolate cyclohydrolase